jgi:hypothetical protein
MAFLNSHVHLPYKYFIVGQFDTEDKGITIFRNVENYLINGTE